MSAPHERLQALASFGAALAEVSGLEAAVDAALASMPHLGFHHVLVMIHQTDNDRLTTIASAGYEEVGIGSEVALGQGVIGKVAENRRSMRIGNLQRMLAYARSVQQQAAGSESVLEIQLPGLASARSQVAAPMIADGILIGVIAAESEQALAFDEVALHVLTVAAQLVAGALERAEIHGRADETAPTEQTGVEAIAHELAPVTDQQMRAPSTLRHYVADGSTFIDDEYVIKGVAGRLLWKLASEHVATGRSAYTNREVRLDPALDMPTFRDNFESRLVLLKRRLEERDAPLRINRTGRGRFDVESLGPLQLQQMEHL